MAPEKLTEYERKRLENIKRNEEMLAALKVHAKASDLSAASKRQRYMSLSLSVFVSKRVLKCNTQFYFCNLCLSSINIPIESLCVK